MRYIALALSLFVVAAYAQQPNGVINAPIYATGYISQVGGTNVTTKIPAQPNHPANQNVYLTGAVTGTWSIQLPNPAFEGQVLSFNCSASATTIEVTSTDGSNLDSSIPTNCNGNSGFVVQFDQRNNIWRNLGSNATTLFVITVNNNTQLTALPTSITAATRLGYATAGDAPAVLYTRNNSACSLNAGSGDGGSQVPTIDGKCWIANLGGVANLALWGADNTGAASVDSKLAAAVAAMKGSGGALEISAGKYLLDGSAQVALSGVKIECKGAPADETVAEANYGKTGATFYITNTSVSPFTDAVGSEVTGCTFFWPNQIENASAPIVYPPLIAPTTSMVDFRFHNNTVVNAYDFIKIGAAATASVVSIDHNRMFVLNKIFNAQGGIHDVVEIRDNFISYAVYEFSVLFNGAGTTYLKDFATSNTTVVAVDNGSASYKSLDGLLLGGNFVFGARYGVNVISGQLDVSKIDGNTFDAVQTAFSMSGTSKVPHLSVRANSVYSYRPGYAATCNPVFDMQSNGANVSNVQFAANNIMFARGNVFNVNNGTGLKDLTSSGDRIDAWGQCSTLGEYYAYAIADGALDVSISNPTLRAVASGSNTMTGFSLNSRTANVDGFNVIAADTVVRAISGKIRLRGQALDTVTASLIDTTGTPSTVDAKGVRWSIVPTKYGFPAFSAVVSGSQTFTGAKTQANFGTTVFDEGGNYSSGTFTTPAAGLYTCRAQLAYTSGSTATDVWKMTLEASGGVIRTAYKTVYASDGVGVISVSNNLKLTASETVSVYMTRNSGTGNYVVPADAQASWFQCERSD